MTYHTEMELHRDVQNRMWNKMNSLFHLELLHGIPTLPGSEAGNVGNHKASVLRI